MSRIRADEMRRTADASDDLIDLIDLVDELTQLIAEENGLLARGLPASISQNLVRKAQLSSELDGWMSRIRNRDDAFTKADRDLHRLLAERLTALQDRMFENMSRLKRAMAVTRWRIEAIMSAVREQTRSEGGYGRNGLRNHGDDHVRVGGIQQA